MNILHITTHLNFGGISSYIKWLGYGLNKRGHKVWVASSGGKLVQNFENNRISHIKININTKCEFNPKLVIALIKLLKIIKENHIQIIHSHTRCAQMLSFWIYKLTGLPFITTCHGFHKLRISRKLLPCWGEKVIAISTAVKEYLVNQMKVPPTKIQLIHNGIDLEYFQDRNLNLLQQEAKKKYNINGRVIGTICRLSSVKATEDLIVAASRLRNDFSDIKVLIIGEGKQLLKLKELVDKLELREMIVFGGALEDVRIPLSIMDVFILTSTQEGLGLSLMEAMACGVPSVACNIGGVNNLVKQDLSGLLISPNSPDQIVLSVGKILNDSKFREFIVNEAKKIIKEKFDLEIMVEKVEKVYNQVINKSHR